MSEEELSMPDAQSRADLYALLAALLLRPDAALIEGLAAAPRSPEAEDALDVAWNELLDSARRLGPAAALQEYDALFVAAGTPRLNPYQCYYRAGWLMDKPLAAR